MPLLVDDDGRRTCVKEAGWEWNDVRPAADDVIAAVMIVVQSILIM